jgi:hypothetical protein
MSAGPRRPGGAGAAAAAASSDAAAASASSNPLLLQSRSTLDAPPMKFPVRTDLPKPHDLTLSEKELVERSRFLSETFKYSGYYVVPDSSRTKLLQAHGLVSSSFAPDSGSTQIYTPTFERYSDRYRKILGKKNFHAEIAQPNPHLFPPELLQAEKGGRNARMQQHYQTTTFTSKVQFLSTKALMNEVTRLVTAKAPSASQHANGGADDAGDTAMETGGEGRAQEKEEREDEEEGDQEMEEEVSIKKQQRGSRMCLVQSELTHAFVSRCCSVCRRRTTWTATMARITVTTTRTAVMRSATMVSARHTENSRTVR